MEVLHMSRECDIINALNESSMTINEGKSSVSTTGSFPAFGMMIDAEISDINPRVIEFEIVKHSRPLQFQLKPEYLDPSDDHPTDEFVKEFRADLYKMFSNFNKDMAKLMKKYGK